jgi:hypothetical protein
VSENEAIFLRGVIGRTATVLHTIGSRHNIKGLYHDTIINEFRGKNEDKRTQMWCAWVQFIEVLAGMKTRQMSWEHNLSDKNDGTSDKNGLSLDNPKGKRMLRSVRTRRDMTIQWDCGLASVKFEGIAASRDSSYDGVKFAEKQPIRLPEVMSHSLKAKSYDSSMVAPEFVHTDLLNRQPSKIHVNYEDIIPLMCFLDGWLEEIKYKDPTYNYKDKT